MNVPFLDLKAQYHTLQGEICEAVGSVFESAAFSGGPYVAKFEEEFAAYCGTRFAIGVGNGTDALWLVMLAHGIGPGDEVITVPNTFIATAEAISLCGAKPVFVDVDEHTYTLDSRRLEKAITPRTKAVIPVHLYGQTADMDAISAIAADYGLVVIEDACQAHGAEYKGRMAGSMGAAGCFSFYPGKNLGAYGEAGAVVTNDPELADTIKMLREHGQSKKYFHSMIGWNARMDGVQGAILSVKLKYLPAANEARRDHARLYHQMLSDLDQVVLPVEADYAKHVYHIFSIRTQKRDDLIEYLAGRNITCGVHYPLSLHLQEAYAPLGIARGAFKVAETVTQESVSLPMFPEMTNDQIHYVCDELKSGVAALGL